ncbi:hypothetical protein IFM89_010776 [Coptis chinensis]|uniref:Uncharacterized protein n=1 Tax=Coptis chinensis TaxID=261450 RepID=A0A835IZI0_9MAGN|nr:hypothetical protein IFM89_010776 [Coptis chinensis]
MGEDLDKTVLLGPDNFNKDAIDQAEGPDWQDFVGIICLLINSTISFIEENKAGNVGASLMACLARKAKKFLEVKFWTKYCQVKYQYRESNVATIVVTVDDDEVIASYFKGDETLANDSRRKLKVEHVALGNTWAVVAEALSRSKQAELDESATQAARMEMVYQMVAIKDLQDLHHKLLFALLSIKDPRQYYDSQHANADRNVGDVEFSTKPRSHNLNTQHTCDFLQNIISDMRENGFSDPVVRPDVALKVLIDLTQHHSSTKYHIGKSPQENVLDQLPEGNKEEALHHSTFTQELLKHF